ncbi:DUF6764 family protein [Rhodococcus sp. HNM0569]|uniref:DUF6764 family protein n=1 Tax=Rhodococcus sp. HNM0569 TaxID=2716340 RepID=UPI00146F770A|nr:DUF6764 family protein [Rhodococcus sp. HNM0569]NLU83127.1 hypothetical protein [Rhodococcus sp. HNM0569]
MPRAFRPARVAGSTSRSSFTKRLARFGAATAVALGVVTGLSVAGAGAASAAPVDCVSPPSDNQILVSETASCGATARDGGLARSGAADSGTAVSTADGQGTTATTYANGFGTALGASQEQGQAYAFALGGGIARSGASAGATTVAIAGWGSGATADANGVDCVGALSLAFNVQTGQACAMR